MNKDEAQTPWNSKYNSELTTIKNKSAIKGWVMGFITGFVVGASIIIMIK